jgi:hypothetical protein
MYGRLLLIGALAAGFAFAQEPAGGVTMAPTPPGNGSVGNGGLTGGGGASTAIPTPLDRMTEACSLSKDQKKQFSAILDADSKAAAPLRKQIPLTREQVGAAALAGKSPEEIKKLEEASGQQTAEMTQIEMKAFGELYAKLDPAQQKVGAQKLYNLLTGMFMKKNWNDAGVTF